MISVYSVFSAVLFYNLAIILVYFLLKKTRFVIDYAASILLLLTVLATARLFLPVDMDSALVLASRYVLPAVQSFFALPVFGLPITVGRALLAVWLLGTLVCVSYDLYTIISARCAKRKFSYVTDERVLKEAARLGIKCAVKISPDITEPYSAHILRPTIYLPDWELSEEELVLVLMHEQQHIRSRDAGKKLLFLLIAAVFWWNPICHMFCREFGQLVEIDCDAKLMAGKTPEERTRYADTLLSVLKKSCAKRPGQFCSSAFSSNAENTMQRFKLILTDRPPKAKRARILLNSLFVAAFILSFFVIIQPRYDPPMDETDGAYIINEDNSFILYEDGKYYLYYNNHYLTELSKKDLKTEDIKDLLIIEGESNKTY